MRWKVKILSLIAIASLFVFTIHANGVLIANIKSGLLTLECVTNGDNYYTQIDKNKVKSISLNRTFEFTNGSAKKCRVSPTTPTTKE